MSKRLFSFSLLYNGTITECQVERRYEPMETYHVVVFNGKEYTLRLKDDMMRFTNGVYE